MGEEEHHEKDSIKEIKKRKKLEAKQAKLESKKATVQVAA